MIFLDVHELRARYWQRYAEMSEKGLKGVDVYEISLDLKIQIQLARSFSMSLHLSGLRENGMNQIMEKEKIHLQIHYSMEPHTRNLMKKPRSLLTQS